MEYESIYNLIPEENLENEKTNKLKSSIRRSKKFSFSENFEEKTKKTFGPPVVCTRKPDQFLKRHEKDFKFPPKAPFKYDDGERKPPVPNHLEKPQLMSKINKNFISMNALEAINSCPGDLQRCVVDSRNGNKQFLKSSGLEPTYLYKKEFGKVPEYLNQRKKEIEENKKNIESFERMTREKSNLRKMTEEEKQLIISGLKANWDLLYKDFLTLPMVIDTPAKMLLKEHLEREMKQLERDAKLIDSDRPIFISEY